MRRADLNLRCCSMASAVAGVTGLCLLLAVVQIGRLPVTRTEVRTYLQYEARTGGRRGGSCMLTLAPVPTEPGCNGRRSICGISTATRRQTARVRILSSCRSTTTSAPTTRSSTRLMARGSRPRPCPTSSSWLSTRYCARAR